MGSNLAGSGLIEVSTTEAGEAIWISKAIAFRKLTALQQLVRRYIKSYEWNTYRFGMPSMAVGFKPREMTTEGSSAQDRVWCLLDFTIWQRFIDNNLRQLVKGSVRAAEIYLQDHL